MGKLSWFKYTLVRVRLQLDKPAPDDVVIELFTANLQAPDQDTARQVGRRRFKFQNGGHAEHERVLERVEPGVGR